MKKTFTLLVTALVLGTGSMMADVVTSIGNLTQWKSFVASVSSGDDYSGKTVMLTADITMESSGFDAQTVGTSSNPFTGTFDGAGFTLTYSNTSLKSLSYCAPFRYIKNATIKNVTVAGEISVQDNNIIGGIVGYVGGASTSDISYIDNCISSITLTNSASSGDGRIGGIVGYQLATSGLQITNCLVEGTITGNNDKKQAAGVMGLQKSGASLTVSSVFLTSTITNKVNTFVKSEDGKQTIQKCYTTIESPDQGTYATTAKLESGEIAYELQNGQATQYWGQSNLNKSTAEAFPKLSSAGADKVIKLSMSNGSAAEYANAGGAMPSPVDKNALSFNNGSGGDPYTSFNNDASMSRCFNKYTLIVPSAGACTLVLPVNVTIPTGVTAYTLTYTSGTKLTATKVEGTTLTANTPVLINAAGGTYVFTSGNSSEITYDTENAKNSGVLCGIYTDTYKYVPKDSYVLQNGSEGLGFYKVDEDNKIKITSFRAYATFTYAGSREFLDIDFNDNITGIKDVKTQSEDSNAPIYNLNGQRVGNDYKGVVIQNGKKFVMK